MSECRHPDPTFLGFEWRGCSYCGALQYSQPGLKQSSPGREWGPWQLPKYSKYAAPNLEAESSEVAILRHKRHLHTWATEQIPKLPPGLPLAAAWVLRHISTIESELSQLKSKHQPKKLQCTHCGSTGLEAIGIERNGVNGTIIICHMCEKFVPWTPSGVLDQEKETS